MTFGLLYTGPDLKTLHEEVAKAGAVDTHAPVHAAVERRIRASPRQVWEVLADLPAWPQTVADVRSMELRGPVAVDQAFGWNNAGTGIESTFAVVEPGRELTWTGKALGTRAVHRNVLIEQEGGTLLRSEESMAGLFLKLLYPSAKLQAGLTRFVEDIAQAVER